MTDLTKEHWSQRTADDYAQAFSDLLPTGPMWPRQPDTVLQKVVAGLSQIWGDQVETLAATLLAREADPRATVTLLPDYERAWGLPDECAAAEYRSVGDRQVALVTKMTLLGAQSREFFVAQAAAIGYTIAIREWSPFMCGISRCGDTTDLDPLGHYRWEIGDSDMRFYWSVKVSALRLTWFRASSGQAGVDPHLRIAGASDLECMLRRWKPAHTEVLFDYSALADIERESNEVAVLPL